jgi:hypothetical protein
MEVNDADFERKLEKLIRIFKKLRDGSNEQLLQGLDKNMVGQIDFLIRNFEMMKSDPGSKAAFMQMGLPFKEMLNSFIERLSDEVGELDDPMPAPENPLLKPVVTAQTTPETKPEVGVMTRRLVQIDQLLAKGELSIEDEDQLLDERLHIMRILNPEEYK